ncbi:MAG: hypothetical protein IJU67_07545, partial [Lachnospiraceae bacterium]|nr:hypothetical protein [Lachnospiraceae bacterium]
SALSVFLRPDMSVVIHDILPQPRRNFNPQQKTGPGVSSADARETPRSGLFSEMTRPMPLSLP